MQVKATYQDGAIHLAQALRFKRRKFEVVVSIPEEALDTSLAPQSALDTLLAQTPDDAWLQRMKAIESRVLSTSDDQIPELTAKQLDRIEAFGLREDR